jgi:N-acetylglucosaminyldiphosphoundecaprenol N-acetyl-beta-D-mannosaminyltransferase
MRRVGRDGLPFTEFGFGGTSPVLQVPPVRRFPALLNILRGEMSFIGPRAASPNDPAIHGSVIWHRFSVRPGLICSWWLRRRANIAFGQEALADKEYVDTRTALGDLGIAVRTLPAMLFGGVPKEVEQRIRILGLPMENLSMDEAVKWIVDRAGSSESSQVCFLNPHCVNLACEDREYRQVILHSDLNLADGIGMKIAGSLTGNLVKENVNGTDLFPRLCAALEGRLESIYLLGAGPHVAEGVCAWVRREHPNVHIAGARDGFFTSEEEPDVVGEIAKSGASILLVALGVPRQDIWISRNLAKTGVRVALGVGGLFDFYSGRIPRAPLWMREVGLEWLYRFKNEPVRLFRRYFIGNFLFLARVVVNKPYRGEIAG